MRAILAAAVCTLGAAATSIDGLVAQDFETPPAAAMDSIFAEWDAPDSPGCVCAVSDAHRIRFEGAWGMANLELRVPLSPRSVFYAASVSKPFVAASIVLLAQRGEFSLDDDARRLLPQLAGLPEPASVRDLARHTSGIRDYFSLFRLAGYHSLDHLDNAKVLRMLERQRSLHFQPGTEHEYSNSNYVLLAELVRRTAGESLQAFTAREIFDPLGMRHTEFEDDHRRVVPGRVTSYERVEDAYRRHLKEFDVVGDGGLLTTARDLTAWGRDLLQPEPAGRMLVATMAEPFALSDGSRVDYGLGLRLGRVAGRRTIGHTGSFKGFRTGVVALPDVGLVVAVLCNSADADASALSAAVVERWLAPLIPETETVAAEAGSSVRPTPGTDRVVELSEDALRQWEGHYWADREASARRLFVREGALFYGRGGNDSRLVAHSERLLSMPGFGIPITLELSRDEDGTRRMTMRIGGFQTLEYEEYVPVPTRRATFEPYTGTYLSEELDVAYRVEPVDDGLTLRITRSGVAAPLAPVMRDLFQATIDSDTYTLRFERLGNRISGFRLDSGLSRALAFHRHRENGR